MEIRECVGTFVFTSDGRELGRVKKVEPSAFLVDAPLAFDYWLETTLVGNCDAERVTLSIGAHELGAYRMDRPYDHNEFQSAPPGGVGSSAVRDSFLTL